MSHLLQVYANACGLEIGEIEVNEKFFPLDTDKYFTIQGGSSQTVKVYDYFNEVMDILDPLLKANKIKVYQIGAKEDVPIKHCHHLMGQTSIPQAAFIAKKSLLHISVDSWIAHFTGWFGRPLVSVYGATTVKNHGPLKYNPSLTKLIESHRNGKVASYGPEQEKSVNKIPPEDIVNSIMSILGSTERLNRESLNIGGLYREVLIEYVPDVAIDFSQFGQTPIVVRFDYSLPIPLSEQLLARAASQRPVYISTNRKINLDLIRGLKKNIQSIRYELSLDEDINYLKELKKTSVKVAFFSREKDLEKLSQIRLKFLDIGLVEHYKDKDKKDFLKSIENYLNKTVDEETAITQNTWYRSNKFLISQNKIFASKAAWVSNAPLQSFEQNIQRLIDIPEFYEEQDSFYVFKQ